MTSKQDTLSVIIVDNNARYPIQLPGSTPNDVLNEKILTMIDNDTQQIINTIHDLKRQNKVLQKQNNQLQQKNDQLQQKNDQLQQKNDQLQQKNDQLQQQNNLILRHICRWQSSLENSNLGQIP